MNYINNTFLLILRFIVVISKILMTFDNKHKPFYSFLYILLGTIPVCLLLNWILLLLLTVCCPSIFFSGLPVLCCMVCCCCCIYSRVYPNLFYLHRNINWYIMIFEVKNEHENVKIQNADLIWLNTSIKIVRNFLYIGI